MDIDRPDSRNFVFVGVDFGGDSCRLSVLDRADKISLHVNRVSNRQTPNLVSFDKRTRIYGEEAEARSSTLFKHTVPLLSYVVGLDKHQLLHFVKSKKYLFFLDFNKEDGSFNVTFDDSPLSVLPTQLYSFFLNKLLETVRQEFNLSDGNEGIYLSLGVPSYFSEEFKQLLLKSLLISNLKRVRLFRESECILKRWADSQLPDSYQEFANTAFTDNDSASNDKSMKVAFLDVGFVHTSFFVAEVKSEDSQLTTSILSEQSSDSISTYNVIESLCDHVKNLIEQKGSKVEVPSRQSYYLYKSCVKCVKELSVLNDAKLDVERVLNGDEDYTTNIARTTLENLVKPMEEKLCTLMDQVVGQTDGKNFYSIEILGGGSRIPFVKNVANKYAESLKCVKGTRTSLDTTSAISYGATKLLKEYCVDSGESTFDGGTAADGSDDAELLDLINREKYMQEVENEQMLKMATLNEIDNYVFKTKSDLMGSYKPHFDDKQSEVEVVLQQLEEFSCGALNDKSVTSKLCQDELKLAQDKVYELAPKYKQQLDEDLRKLEASANSTTINDIVSGLNGTGSKLDSLADSDVVLPNKTCIKRAQKNKEEGNELIGAGNIELAIQHYVKVLQYCGKVNSPSDEEKEVVNGLRLASNLNLAMCYIKLDVPASLNKAISCCTSALSISPTNTKALFRRGLAYEKLNDFENAMKDAKKGVELEPQNQDFKNGESRYRRRINRLTEKIKYAIFFAHTASKNKYVTLNSKSLRNSKETVLDYSTSQDIDNCSDSTCSYATNNINDSINIYVANDVNDSGFGVDQLSHSHDTTCVNDLYLEEFGDLDEFEDLSMIIKSTKKCKDELIARLNSSYDDSKRIRRLYSLSPIDYRIDSLKNALIQLNTISKVNKVM